jgi:hypothetical protein
MILEKFVYKMRRLILILADGKVGYVFSGFIMRMIALASKKSSGLV